MAEEFRKNRIQVSSSKKSVFFYVNLSKTMDIAYNVLQKQGKVLVSMDIAYNVLQKQGKVLRYLQQYNDVELSGLGMAISSVVSIAEILKNDGFAIEKKIRTLTVDMRDDPRARPFPKAKIEILLGKSENFDELMAAEVEEGEEEGGGEE